MSEFSDATYAFFALQQPVTLEEMAELTPEQRLLMASARTPEWFAAAASSASRLSEIAPELRVMGDQDGADVDGIDLVWLFAPELRTVEEAPSSTTSAAPEAAGGLDQRPPAVQISLLRELSELDD